MASSACRCASTSAVTGSHFRPPAERCCPGYPPTRGHRYGTGIPRTTFTGDSHHHTAVGLSRAIRTPSCMLSASRLSRYGCPAGPRTAHPRCLSPVLTAESPQPVSVIRGQWVQPDTADLPLRSNAGSATYGCGYLPPVQ